jgi:ubiquinone/menaquinone biosynthesis C-methylase UbiE
VFTRSARLYDFIYGWKDYAGEAEKVHGLIQGSKQSRGSDLLEVACGTGSHIQYLRQHYRIEALDLDAKMLEVARERVPNVVFHQADMADFRLNKRFDAVICLFSSIGYVRTVARLREAIARMREHLKPGGVLVVEPWFTPEDFQTGMTRGVWVDLPELKICRMNTTVIEQGLSVLDFHYLVGTPAGVEHFRERHEMGLFTNQDLQSAFEALGLRTLFDPECLMQRGLWLGVAPVESG